MATTRLEYRKGTSSKFWEISSGSASYTVRFGRVGAGGQRQTKRIAGAQAEARRLIAAKLKKGYRLVSGKEVSAAQVRAIVGELDRVIRAYLRSNDKDPDDRGRYNLYPGASAVDIARYERQLGRDLPPSYRHFLRAHNGWLGFWGDNALLGAPRPYNAKRYAYVRRDLRRSDGYLDDDDEGPDYYRAADVIPIACDLNGGFVGFDMQRIDARGEPQIIDCIRTNGCVDNRYRDFIAFMKMRVRCAKRSIRKNRRT